ncbi:MAG: hypothetical protein IT179_01500 [Acidobacteria bacterium]|nr:hypothetical protein [Acidobacteriota bacterium]
MKRLRAEDVKRVVGAASEALNAVLDTRSKVIEPDMLNSAGSVSAEWYVETLWHYLAKRSLLQGVSSLDVEFKQPARPADRQLHYAVPHPEADALVMAFHVLRKARDPRRREKIPVALIKVNRVPRRRRHGVAPDPPYHPYGIEVRRRHLNSLKRVSWHTLVSVIMDVARRGVQFADTRFDRLDRSLLYIVPRFTFTPLADAAAEDNLFIYPEFGLPQPWAKGRTSAVARVTFWAVANEAPWPIAESQVTVVRTSLVDGVRRPVDEQGRTVAKPTAVA